MNKIANYLLLVCGIIVGLILAVIYSIWIIICTICNMLVWAVKGAMQQLMICENMVKYDLIPVSFLADYARSRIRRRETNYKIAKYEELN